MEIFIKEYIQFHYLYKQFGCKCKMYHAFIIHNHNLIKRNIALIFRYLTKGVIKVAPHNYIILFLFVLPRIKCNKAVGLQLSVYP